MEALIYLSWTGFIGLVSCLIYGIWQEIKIEYAGNVLMDEGYKNEM